MAELIDAIGRRALSYVVQLADQGYALTKEQFQVYATHPERKHGSAIPKGLLKDISASGDMLKKLAGAFEYAPGETVLDWFARLEWVRVEGSLVRATALGRAVLAAAAKSESEIEPPTQISLSPSDELAYPRILGLIARAGPSSLVDGFFKPDNLRDIIQHTRVGRILVRPDEVLAATLAAAVKQLNPARELEIRASEAFHDRFIIPDAGRISLIGTSLSGVGKRFSLSVEIDEDEAARAVRTAFEGAWSQAILVTRVNSANESKRGPKGERVSEAE